MFRRLTADKDAMITNKVISNQQVTDANVGHAGTLDLFRLFNESVISGSSGTVDEVSRLLIHFDLDPLRELTGSILDINDSSFECTLKMTDVFGGQTVPSNFTLALFPLSKSFDEGIGRDINSFRDLDAANFITASVSSQTPVTWSVSGAADPVNDYIEAQGVFQDFTLGTEDLSMDVTDIVSGVLAGDLSDYGMRISFSGTHETDDRSRFVKRLISRHANDRSKQPIIEAKWDDSVQDDHQSFCFDSTGTIYLNNFKNGEASNLMSGANEISGLNSLLVRIVSGSSTNTFTSGTIITGTQSGTQFLSQTVNDAPSTFFEKIFTASQLQIGDNFQTGIYCATFAVAQDETGSLFDEVKLVGSATFQEIWYSLDGTMPFFTGSLVIKQFDRSTFITETANPIIRVTNNRGAYEADEKVRFRVYAQRNLATRLKAGKEPLLRKSDIFKTMQYQIRDANSKRILIPFDATATKMSIDSDGMYFDLFMDSLDPGLVYGIDIKYTDRDVTMVSDFTEIGAVFRVDT